MSIPIKIRPEDRRYLPALKVLVTLLETLKQMPELFVFDLALTAQEQVNVTGFPGWYADWLHLRVTHCIVGLSTLHLDYTTQQIIEQVKTCITELEAP